MSKTRRHFTAEQKAEIVRHLAGKEPVSNLVLAQAERAFDQPAGQQRQFG